MTLSGNDGEGVNNPMEQAGIERRRGRRATVQASLSIRRASATPSATPGQPKEAQARNVSLAGVYFESDEPYQPNEIVTASVSIPESAQSREFPFTRVAGRSRVVRVEELPSKAAGAQKQFGVALEFGSDVIALSAIPGRG